MTINIFKGIYLVPPKCGSRFFDEHWGNTREFIDLFELKDSKFVDEIKFIVLRESIEYMKTALHTEFINFWNGSNKKGNITETDLLDYISKEDITKEWLDEFNKIYNETGDKSNRIKQIKIDGLVMDRTGYLVYKLIENNKLE